MANSEFRKLPFTFLILVALCNSATISTRPTESSQPTTTPTELRGVSIVEKQFDPKSCSPGTYPAQGQCILLGPNCLTYDSHGECLSCSTNLHNVNGRCVPILSRVQTCLAGSPGNCTQCAPNTNSPRPGYCEQVEPNCRMFDSEGACLICQPGLVFDRNLCLSHLPALYEYEDEHCLVWSKRRCIQCAEGWEILSSGEPCSDKALSA